MESEETLYTPESQLRHPIRLLRSMFRDLAGSRELAWRLMIRDISAQYRQTALGYFWAIFPPLVSSIVFILMKSSQVLDVSSLGLPYPVYVLTGTVFWQLFVDSLNAPLKIATESKAILTKINLPKEALILSGIGQVLFGFFIKLLLLAGVLIYFRTPVHWTSLLVPLPLMGMLLLGTMLGILLIPVGLLYKDIQSALLVATSGLMLLAPVVFPYRETGALGIIMKYNPITYLLMGARDLLFNGIPRDIFPLALVFGITLVLLFFGWILYRIAIPIITERIGA